MRNECRAMRKRLARQAGKRRIIGATWLLVKVYCDLNCGSSEIEVAASIRWNCQDGRKMRRDWPLGKWNHLLLNSNKLAIHTRLKNFNHGSYPSRFD